MLLHLIRHGHAGHRSDWHADDELRPLVRRGEREAEAIAAQLTGQPIDVVWSSAYVRCRQTVEPLARDRGLEVVTHPAFTEGQAGPPALDALLAAAAEGQAVAACSHGDVIPAIVVAAVRRGATLVGPPSPAKGARYELEVVDGQVARITHVGRPDT